MDRRVKEAAERLAELIAGNRCADGYPIDGTTGEPATWAHAAASEGGALRARILRGGLLALVAAIARSEPAPHGVELSAHERDEAGCAAFCRHTGLPPDAWLAASRQCREAWTEAAVAAVLHVLSLRAGEP